MLRLIPALLLLLGLTGCPDEVKTSDTVQTDQQEKILMEGTIKVGLPAIINFRERELMKLVYEARDRSDYLTYTYTYSEVTGKFTFFCRSVGFPIPYATQMTNPQKIEKWRNQVGYAILPQADPNGLFTPASAEGTWVACFDPNTNKLSPIYVEPKVTTSSYKIPQAIGNPTDKDTVNHS